MIKTYRCWCPDLEEETAARTYEANTWKEAAEAFARWSYREEEFDELIVNVRFSNGALYQISAEAEMELSMHLGMEAKLEGKRDQPAAPTTEPSP